jgi:uncharacterized radical SAM superfamily Fe-S cluster-containing enzyme
MIKTESLCPVCKKKLKAELTEAEGKIVITKTCLEQRAHLILYPLPLCVSELLL